MSQNTKLKQVALWYVRNRDRAMFMHADPAKFGNVHNFINTERMDELKEALGPKLIEEAEYWDRKHPQTFCVDKSDK